MPFNFLQQEREQGGKNQVLGIDDSNVGSPRPGHRKIAIGVSCSREELTKFKNFLVLSLYATYHTENSESVCSDASHGKCLEKHSSLEHLKNKLDKALPRPDAVKFYAGSSQRA